MSYTSEHRRLAPVLAKARQLDIATNHAPEALFESLTASFNLWCTPEDHPQGWDGVSLIAGAFAKPCGFVGTASWKWDDDRIVAVSLGTDAYDLADCCPQNFSRTAGKDWISIHNRPEDLEWSEQKIHWLFAQAGVLCPPIVIE
jgi:hypothetical protein